MKLKNKQYQALLNERDKLKLKYDTNKIDSEQYYYDLEKINEQLRGFDRAGISVI